MPAITDPPTLAQLIQSLGTAAGHLDDDQRRVALTTYRLLAAGEPVTDAAIAQAAGVDETTVAGYLAGWDGVFRDGDGSVVGFWGLALQPLDPVYELRDHHSGRPVGYAWCAWDTLFLPAVLGRTLDVVATDGHTGDSITLTVSPGGVRQVAPEGVVVSFVAPDGPWEADILTTFCHKVVFFADHDRADAWIAGHPDPLFTLDVEDAFEVGRRWTADRYGDALG